MQTCRGRSDIVRSGRSMVAVGAVLVLVLVAWACAGKGTSARPASSPPASSPTSVMTLPSIPPTGTSTPPSRRERGVWMLIASSPLPSSISAPTGAWDGTELVVSGRVCTDRAPYRHTVTAAYDPATDSWRMLPPYRGPKGCFEGADHALWDGHEMLLLGVTNAAYDPSTNSWRRLPGWGGGGGEVNAWTGRQTLTFGGGCCGDQEGMGSSYVARTNRWTQPPAGPLVGRHGVVGVWDGHGFVVAGGYHEVEETTENGTPVRLGPRILLDAAAYDPSTRAWRSLAPMPRLPGVHHVWSRTAVWDGSEMLVVSAFGNLAYDPATDRWRLLPDMRFQRGGAGAVWTGTRMLVWGGATNEGEGAPPYGEAYDPAIDRWLSMPPSPLRHRYPAVVVWTGTQMIIWGGDMFPDGATFTPVGS